MRTKESFDAFLDGGIECLQGRSVFVAGDKPSGVDELAEGLDSLPQRLED